AVLRVPYRPLAGEPQLHENPGRRAGLSECLGEHHQSGLGGARDGDERPRHLRREPSPLEPVERVIGDLDAPVDGRALDRALAPLNTLDPGGVTAPGTFARLHPFDPNRWHERIQIDPSGGHAPSPGFSHVQFSSRAASQAASWSSLNTLNVETND